MKKALIAFAVIFSAVAAAAFAGCTSTDYTDAPVGERISVYETDPFASELSEFLKVNSGDRTCLVPEESPEGGNGEHIAAEWIADRLETLTGTRGRIEDIERDVYTDTFYSQNVVYSVEAPAENNPDGYRVVVGAHYDNMYDTSRTADGRAVYFSGTEAEGAMGNGAAVATMLVMCDYFADHASELSVDVDFVFYGMGCIDRGGAEEYYYSLGESGRNSVILAVTLAKLGGDDLWFYFDEQSTAHGDFIMGVAESSGYGEYVSEPPARLTDPDIRLTDELPYTPYALINESSVYFGKTNVCSVTSGSDFTFLLYDKDVYGSDNIAYTGRDTLETLAEADPGYADQMRVAAEVITASVYRDGFTKACENGLNEIGSYAWLTSRLAAYIAGGVLAAGVLVFSILMVKRLGKKYSGPDDRPNIKVAVFGMDYEDPEDGDIYVDLHSRGGPEDPFGDDPFGDENDKK